MKQKKLAPILTLAMSLELILAPTIAHSQSGFDKILSSIGQVWKGANGNRQMDNSQFGQDMQALVAQQTAQPDKYFSQQNMGRIPGLMEYMALSNLNPQMLDCRTLPTTLSEASPQVCRIGLDGSTNIPPQAQLDEMFTYYNQYGQVNKMYDNFSADSNSAGQMFGLGCMNNAMNILNGFFKSRLKTLGELEHKLELEHAAFKEKSKADLEALKEAIAVLEGGNSEITNDVRNRKPEKFEFGEIFGKDTACISMLNKDEFDNTGKGSGLNGISKILKQSLNAPSGPNKFSGESYSKSHSAVVADLNKLADKAAKQFELNFSSIAGNKNGYNEFLTKLPGSVSSTQGSQNALIPDLFSDIQSKFLELDAKNQQDRGDIESILAGGRPGKALDQLGNLNSGTFENEVKSIENRLKNDCLARNLTTTGGLESLFKNIYNAKLNKGSANTNQGRDLKKDIDAIISNSNLSVETKMEELQKINDTTFYFKAQSPITFTEAVDDGNGTFTLKKVTVPQSQRTTPSDYLTGMIKTCDAEFKKTKVDNKSSGYEAIKKLRTLNQTYKSLATNHAADIKKEIKKKLIECSSPEIANNTTAGSCTPAKFDTSSKTFCANAAFSCSKNMQACNLQADTYVKNLKKQKTDRVNNYKGFVNKYRMDTIAIFDKQIMARFMNEAKALSGLFGAGFSVPTDIKREVNPKVYQENFKSATSGSADGELLLEDPDEYLKMLKSNIQNLKKTVEDQQNQILEGTPPDKYNGILAHHIKQTKFNYKVVKERAEKFSKECLSNHDGIKKAQEAQRLAAQAKQQEASDKLGQQNKEFCDIWRSVQENPMAGCAEKIKDDLYDGARAGGAGKEAAQLRAVCRQYNNESKGSSGMETKAYRHCRKSVGGGLDISEEKSLNENLNKAAEALTKLEDKKESYETKLLEAASEQIKKNYEAAISKLDEDIKIAKEKHKAAEDKLTAAVAKAPAKNKNMSANCKHLIEICITKTTGTGNDKESSNPCSDTDKTALVELIIEESGEKYVTLDSDSAPGICVAGNTTGRGILDTLSQTFNREMASGTVAPR